MIKTAMIHGHLRGQRCSNPTLLQVQYQAVKSASVGSDFNETSELATDLANAVRQTTVKRRLERHDGKLDAI